MNNITNFDTGAIRDTQEGKPNFYECMSPLAYWRYGVYMDKASQKYGPDNWTKGIPIESYMKSLERHLTKLKAEMKYGIHIEEGVDHASAIMFNIMGFIHEQEKLKYRADEIRKIYDSHSGDWDYVDQCSNPDKCGHILHGNSVKDSTTYEPEPESTTD